MTMSKRLLLGISWDGYVFSPEGVNLGMGINENKPEETSKKEPWIIGYSMGSMDQ